MKIAVLIYSLAGGGAERVVSQLLNYINSEENEVHLVLMKKVIVYEVPKNISIHYLENSNPEESGIFKILKLPFLALRYRKILNKHDITVSLSFLTRPNYINSLANFFSKKRKIILSERSNPTAQYHGKSFHSIINRFLISKLFPFSDIIISNSEGNRKELIECFKVPEKKIITIHNPIDLKKVEEAPVCDGFYNNDYFNFISVGRLNEGKNHELLIRSLATIQNKNIRLYIFGEGNLKSFLSNLILELKLENQVFLNGFSTEIFSYLKGADAFLFGSKHEGFPNVLIEAMACELPIVSTNCNSGPNEIMEVYDVKEIQENIITGYGILVPLNNKSLMAKAIIELVDNKQYYDSCKKKVISRAFDFRKESILKQYGALLKNRF
jgi:N-acetylgalactosamine-N,N'-diacetylbacillosaminyl-diphospho-undecaprenol 4-alpha-N-acetylgalactosaminyltransferase